MTEGYLWTLPIVGALLGYVTNWLAVRMLFRPRTPRRFLGVTFVGLVPRRRAELAARVAEAVSRELVRSEDVSKLLDDPALAEMARDEIDSRVRVFLARKFDELPGIALAVLPSDLEDRLRASIVKHVMNALPEISARLSEKLGERIDIRAMVEERINGFDIRRLEEIVLEISRRELRWIELLGGIIGAVVGGAQWALLHFLG
jgi:uncharacterized membrane protein YheB (UPF0754 family)